MSFLSAIKNYRMVWTTLSIQLVLMALFHFTLLTLLEQWLSMQNNPSVLFWVFIFSACIPLLALGILSSTVLAVIGGYFIGWNSFFYYLPCYVLSSYAGYEFIRRIDQGRTLLALQHSQKLKKALSFLRLYPFGSVVFLRFSPIISFGQLTALCSFAGIPRLIYLSATTLGMIPRTLLALWSGIYIRVHFESLLHYQLPSSYRYLLLFLFVFSMAGVIYLINRSFKSTKALY